VAIKLEIDAEGKLELAEGKSGGPQIIMLIPPNFTEVSKVADE
jgi:hypothetical protein